MCKNQKPYDVKAYEAVDGLRCMLFVSHSLSGKAIPLNTIIVSRRELCIELAFIQAMFSLRISKYTTCCTGCVLYI